MVQLTKANIKDYSARYDVQAVVDDKRVEALCKQLLKTQRYLIKDEFVQIGVWKSQRPKKWYEDNDPAAVEELTKFSFSVAKAAQSRLGALLALKGVDVRVASVLLHFAFPEEYAILDFRVVWSLGWEEPKAYTTGLFWKYCARIREIATENTLPLRTVEKALWQYSKEHQPTKKAQAAGG